MNNVLYIMVGLSIMLYNVYVRLILTRLPKVLSTNLTSSEILCIGVVILVFISLFLFTSYRWYKITYSYFKEGSTPWIVNKVKHIIMLYVKSLQNLDSFIKDVLLEKYLGSWLLYFTNIINEYFRYTNSYKYFWTFIILNVLPKTFVILIFSIDIMYLNEFKYIYVCAGLLIIPLLFNYMLFTLKEFAEYNIYSLYGEAFIYKFHSGKIMTAKDIIDECKGIISVEDCYTNDLGHYSIRVVELTEEYFQICINTADNITDTIIFYTAQFTIFTKLRSIVSQFEIITIKYGLIFDAIRFLLYALLWLYILHYGIPCCSYIVSFLHIDIYLSNLVFSDTVEPFSQLNIDINETVD